MVKQLVRVLVFAALLSVLMYSGAAWGALSVAIITPSTEPFSLNKDVEQEFEAVAYLDGQELESGQVSWEWDFDDGTSHVFVNPTSHEFTEYGLYDVTVTVQHQGQSATDTVLVCVGMAGNSGGGPWSPKPGWWFMSTQVGGAPTAVLQHVQGETRQTDNHIDEASNSGPGWSEYARGMWWLWGAWAEASLSVQSVWTDAACDAYAPVVVEYELLKSDPAAEALTGEFTELVTSMNHFTGDCDHLGNVYAYPRHPVDANQPISYFDSGAIGACSFHWTNTWADSCTLEFFTRAYAAVSHHSGVLPVPTQGKQTSHTTLNLLMFQTIN